MLKRTVFAGAFVLLAVNMVFAEDLTRMLKVSDWTTVEATKKELQIAKSNLQTPAGGDAIVLKFTVDKKAGWNAETPIGSPQALFKLNASETDWSKYENFEYMVYAKSNRKELPPSGLEPCVGPKEIGKSPSETGAFETAGPIEKMEQWQTVTIPIEKIEDSGCKTNDIKMVIFSITEAKYQDKDTIDFHLGGFRLTGKRKE